MARHCLTYRPNGGSLMSYALLRTKSSRLVGHIRDNTGRRQTTPLMHGCPHPHRQLIRRSLRAKTLYLSYEVDKSFGVQLGPMVLFEKTAALSSHLHEAPRV